MIVKKIRELRKTRGMTAKQLGNVLNVAESTISLYENGKRAPDYEMLKKISAYFGVSVDYLLDNNELAESTSSSLAAGFGMLMRKVREEKGITVEQMAYDLGMSPSLLIGIEAKSVPPSLNAAIKIADYLEVSTDYLLGMEEKEKRNSNNELRCDPPYFKKPAPWFSKLSDPQNIEFIELFSKLTPEERKIILDLIKNFASNKM